MRIILLTERPCDSIEGLKQFQKKLAESRREVTCLSYSSKTKDIIQEIKALHPDLLITVDLPGFERCTLTDNIAYNLLSCKQLHLLLHRNLPNESYLGRPLNIAMFFYCAGDAYYDYLTQQYPDMPYLQKLPDWRDGTDRQAEESNAQALYAAFEEVLRESLLQP